MTPGNPAHPISDFYTLADLLASCPGMKKEDVYYLEQQGYLHPLKQRHGRVERNLFTRQQAELLFCVWKYRQSGLPPRKAYQRALKEKALGQLPLF